MTKVMKILLLLICCFSSISGAQEIDKILLEYISQVKLATKVTIPPVKISDNLEVPVANSFVHKSLFHPFYNSPRHDLTTVTINTPHTEAIPIHYRDVQQLVNLLQNNSLGLLSTVGRMSADNHNNILWIHDDNAHIVQLKKMIAEYDQAIPQIYIKAKIVHVDEDYVHSL